VALAVVVLISKRSVYTVVLLNEVYTFAGIICFLSGVDTFYTELRFAATLVVWPVRDGTQAAAQGWVEQYSCFDMVAS
jgi:hypothetical protein